MRAVLIDDGQLQVAAKRRFIYRLPHSGNMRDCAFEHIDLHHNRPALFGANLIWIKLPMVVVGY